MVKDGLDGGGMIGEVLEGFDKVDYLSSRDLGFKWEWWKEGIEDVVMRLNEDDLKCVVDDGDGEVWCDLCGEKYELNKDELSGI